MEEKKLPRLFNRYRFQIALTIFFTVLIALIPFFYLQLFPSSNIQLKLMTMRCFGLNFLSGALFFWFEGGKFRELLPFPVAGVILSLIYLKIGNFLLLLFCLPATATSVLMVALIAFTSIKVKFER